MAQVEPAAVKHTPLHDRHIALVDETWRGGVRRRYVSEIRQLTRAIENNRPVTHLTYQSAPTSNEPAGFFPHPDLANELAAFRRPLPAAMINGEA